MTAAEAYGRIHIVIHAFSFCMQMTRPASPAKITQQPKQNVVSYRLPVELLLCLPCLTVACCPTK